MQIVEQCVDDKVFGVSSSSSSFYEQIEPGRKGVGVSRLGQGRVGVFLAGDDEQPGEGSLDRRGDPPKQLC